MTNRDAGADWIYKAFQRVRSGEGVAAVLLEHGYVPVEAKKAKRRAETKKAQPRRQKRSPDGMHGLRFPTKREESQYMRMRLKENRERSKVTPAENWMAALLKERSGFKWKRQVMWGYRIFDFWSSLLDVAIEVDGATHDPEYDSYRDEYNFRRSAIVVLRVPNFNEATAERAIMLPKYLGRWKVRRNALGIKDECWRLVNKNPERRFHKEFLGSFGMYDNIHGGAAVSEREGEDG